MLKPLIRDETLRDGNQGEVPRSAFQAIQHILSTHQWYDMMSIGWIYTNPADKEAAQYLRDHLTELQSKPGFSDVTKEKFFVYTLMHRTDARTGAVKLTADQSAMLEDMQKSEQPYGTVNVLSKARVRDLEDLGYSGSEHCVSDLDQTMGRLHKANPLVKKELALEHIYTAWIESPENHQHIVNMITTALKYDKHMLITAPDTDGAHAPEDIKRVIKELTEAVQEVVPGFSPSQFIIHAHKDRGYVEGAQGRQEQSVANVQAALEAGAGAIDCCAGRMGERRGNMTLADLAKALDWKDKDEMAAYQHDFEQSLGIREGDKPPGGMESMCAVGGMHSARLWNEFMRQRQTAHRDNRNKTRDIAGWVNYDEFVSAPRGSYASVPPDIFVPKQKLQVTLSPVAGGSNVQHMLARLGMIVENKADPRVQSVLTAVKKGEHEGGENFRGYNNINAMLLVADTFGLRKDKHSSATVPPAHLGGGDLEQQANTVLQMAIKPWRSACRWLDDIEITEARQVTMYKGKLSADPADVTKPVQSKCQSVRLRFKTHKDTEEYYYAYGVGEQKAEALAKAVAKIVDWKFFEMERLKYHTQGHQEHVR